jgi:hypothetical protein
MAYVDFVTVEEQYNKFKGYYCMHDTCMPVLFPPQGTTRLKMVVASELMTNMLEYFLDMIHLLTAIGLTPGGSSTVHIYSQTIHRTTQLIWEECGLCSIFMSYVLAFALQLREKHGKTSVKVAEECQLAR